MCFSSVCVTCVCLFRVYTCVYISISVYASINGCIHMHISLNKLKHFSGDPNLFKAAAVFKNIVFSCFFSLSSLRRERKSRKSFHSSLGVEKVVWFRFTYYQGEVLLQLMVVVVCKYMQQLPRPNVGGGGVENPRTSEKVVVYHHFCRYGSSVTISLSSI